MKWPSKMIFIVVLPLFSPRMNIQQKQNLLCKNYIPFRIFQKHGKFLCVWLGVISSSINILISEEWYSNLLVWSFFMTTSQEEEESCYRQLLGSHFNGGSHLRAFLLLGYLDGSLGISAKPFETTNEPIAWPDWLCGAKSGYYMNFWSSSSTRYTLYSI